MNKIEDPVFETFLRRQWEEGLTLAAASDVLRLRPVAGMPPFRYFAHFACKGLARHRTGRIVEHDQWDVAIQFPPDYLRSPIHPSQILAFLGPGNRPDLLPWHPNIRDCFICLEVTTGMPLTQILYGLFELLTWRLFSTRDEGLNHPAAQYARNQPMARFPIDPRPLKRRATGTFEIEELTSRP